MHRVFLILSFLLAVSYVDASQNVRLEQVSLEEGLSQTNVSHILQDADGFLWFGTSQGLNFYDGHSIRIVGGPENLLEIQAIDALSEDSKNDIWVGSVPNKIFEFERLIIPYKSSLLRFLKTMKYQIPPLQLSLKGVVREYGWQLCEQFSSTVL